MKTFINNLLNYDLHTRNVLQHKLRSVTDDKMFPLHEAHQKKTKTEPKNTTMN